MSNETTHLPVFTADFSSMARPADYIGGMVVRYAPSEASQAVTQPLPVLR